MYDVIHEQTFFAVQIIHVLCFEYSKNWTIKDTNILNIQNIQTIKDTL